MIRYSPVVPMISDGQYKRTPIHVRDFARIGLSMIDIGLDGLELDAGGDTDGMESNPDIASIFM